MAKKRTRQPAKAGGRQEVTETRLRPLRRRVVGLEQDYAFLRDYVRELAKRLGQAEEVLTTLADASTDGAP